LLVATKEVAIDFGIISVPIPYAGGWCGLHQTPPVTNHNRLISAAWDMTWTVENVVCIGRTGWTNLAGEFYFDDKETLQQLYVP
jgi:hypothetical protein